MSASALLRAALNLRTASVVLQRRCVAASATPSDPIQQLFVEKIRDYAQKSKLAGGKLVDATPAVQSALAEDIDKLNKQFGASGDDLNKLPVLNFTDATLSPAGIQFQVKEVAETESAAKGTAEEDEELL